MQIRRLPAKMSGNTVRDTSSNDDRAARAGVLRQPPSRARAQDDDRRASAACGRIERVVRDGDTAATCAAVRRRRSIQRATGLREQRADAGREPQRGAGARSYRRLRAAGNGYPLDGRRDGRVRHAGARRHLAARRRRTGAAGARERMDHRRRGADLVGREHLPRDRSTARSSSPPAI